MIDIKTLKNMVPNKVTELASRSVELGMRYAVVSIKSGKLDIYVITASYSMANGIALSTPNQNLHVASLVDIIAVGRS